MNSIRLDGNWSTVKTAMETMGFTVTVVTPGASGSSYTDYKCYYDNDTNGKVYLLLQQFSATQFYMKFCLSNGTSVASHTRYYTANYNFDYEITGRSLIFGVSTSSTVPSIQFLIVAPKSNDDDWIYCPAGATSWAFINGRTDSTFVNSPIKIKTNNTAVQIVKIFDGNRFMDNVYQTSVSPDLPVYTGQGNFIYATIGTKNYFLAHIFDTQTSRSLVAIERT